MKSSEHSPGLPPQTETALETSTWEGAETFRLPALTLLFHPDPERVGERVVLPALTSGGEVELSRLAPAFSAPGSPLQRPLDDPRLSRRPVRLLSGQAAGAIRLDPGGTSMSLHVEDAVAAGQVEVSNEELERGVVLLLAQRIVLLLHRLDPMENRDLPSYGLVGHSRAMAAVRRDIRQVADLDVPVLITGETGTGKELVAAAIHRGSPRAREAYVAISMAAIPASLAAAELFGSVKGAFTGSAKDRQGYFRRAEGGTLFLDEIGETPEELQALLLRSLETREIQPVGADRAQKVNVRLVAATDLDLDQAVADGRFRAPLLYRLSGYEISIPPLRQRRDDFGRLFFHFLRAELEGLGLGDRLAPPPRGSRTWVPAPLVARLASHPWPGNVRQLRNVVRQLVIANRDGERLQLPPSLERFLRTTAESAEGSKAASSSEEAGRRSLAEISERELLDALREHRWKIQDAARHLGISRAAVYKLVDASSKVRKASDLGLEEIESSRERCGENLNEMVEDLEVSGAALRRRMRQLGLR